MPPPPDRTFDRFAVGPSNAVALAAATAALAQRWPPGNPLSLHGGPGVGKTHLLQAIVLAASAGGRHAAYFPGGEVSYGLAGALRRDVAGSLRDHLRQLEVLALDDLHRITAAAVRREVVGAAAAVIARGGVVALAASTPPRDLDWGDTGLGALIEGGLVIEIGPPDPALLRAVALARLTALGVAAWPADAIAALVGGVPNARVLGGVVTRILAEHQVLGVPIDVDLVARHLADLAPAEPAPLRIEQVVTAVCAHYGVARVDLVSARRTRAVVWPRQVAMWLARTVTTRSLPEIGRRLGGRDHTTVLHAVHKIAERMAADPEVRADLEALRQRLERRP